MNDQLFGVSGSSTASRASGTASTRIYTDLRDRIVRLELPPDTTLDRSELAEQYGVSQSPVREAMLRLEQDGLVRSFPQSRTVVTRIDVSRIREEHFLRVAVESEVVRQLAESADPSVVTKLKGLLRLQAALVGDVEQADLDASEADRIFSILMGENVELRRDFIERNAVNVKNLDV